jgi:hypothetical protein
MEAQIEFQREAMQANTEFETALQIGSIRFPSGQAFEDWMAEKQLQLSNIKQEEIIQ